MEAPCTETQAERAKRTLALTRDCVAESDTISIQSYTYRDGSYLVRRWNPANLNQLISAVAHPAAPFRGAS